MMREASTRDDIMNPAPRSKVAPTALTAARGVTLVITLMMLMIVGIVSVGAIRSLIGDERLAGNSREKQRALNLAISTQSFAEAWLKAGSNAQTVLDCSRELPITEPARVCTNEVLDPSETTWTDTAGNTLGNYYDPGNIVVSDSAPTGTTFFRNPKYYIQRLGAGKDGRGDVFRVYAMSYGATPATVSVVSSTVQITIPTKDLTRK